MERIWKDSVKCIVQNTLGIDKEKFFQHKQDIEDMLSQIEVDETGVTLVALANHRKDGETWTPYLQIVEMLLRMGHRMGFVELLDGGFQSKNKIKIILCRQRK